MLRVAGHVAPCPVVNDRTGPAKRARHQRLYRLALDRASKTTETALLTQKKFDTTHSTSAPELPNRFLQRKSDFDRHLPVLNASFFDVTARVYDFEPAEIVQTVSGAVNSILNGVLDRLRR